MKHIIIIILIVFITACVDGAKPVPVEDAPPMLDAPVESCTKTLSGPTPIGGGNTYCDMTVTIMIDCAPGADGQFAALYGESPSPTLAAASVQAAYQCGVPIVLSRDGIDCSSLIAADVVWWSPEGVGPTTCN